MSLWHTGIGALSFRHRGVLALLALLLLGVVPMAAATPQVSLFAAASLTDAMDEAVTVYEARHDVDIVPVYASSSTLARQIANGAPADLFVSANEKWMDWLAQQGLDLSQRVDLLHNRLVLIAPETSDVKSFIPGKNGSIANLLAPGERLSLGDPGHVPAGIYARQALEILGEWQKLQPRLARSGDVRGALMLVERGEAPVGVVYRTDALASDKVRQLGLFAADSHDPITYPVALIDAGANSEAAALRRWLAGDEARAIFESYGFSAVDAAAP